MEYSSLRTATRQPTASPPKGLSISVRNPWSSNSIHVSAFLSVPLTVIFVPVHFRTHLDSETAVSEFETAVSNSETAVSDSKTAVSESKTAVSKSETAVSVSQTAVSDSETAVSESVSESETAVPASEQQFRTPKRPFPTLFSYFGTRKRHAKPT